MIIEISFWTAPGCDANLPRIGTSVDYLFDSNIEKVNSMSLKQITLGYDLPKVIAAKIGFKGEILCYRREFVLLV